MGLLGLAIAAAFVMPLLGPRLVRALQAPFSMAGSIDIGEQEAGVVDVEQLIYEIAFHVALVVGPLMGTLLFAGIVAIFLQGEIAVSAERIRPQITRLSPMSGFRSSSRSRPSWSS